MGGQKHRQLFIEKSSNNYNMGNLSQADLLGAARKFSENDQKLGDLILTRHSDEEYPWPPAKAPWARERGGSGIPPAGARKNYGNKKHIMIVPVAQLSGKFSAPDN